MPFRESNRVEECIALFRNYDSGACSVSELCRQRGISRETFYVLKRRRDGGDERWFEVRSRSPKSCPHATSQVRAAAIIQMRKRFPHFGPKKVRAKLMAEQPGIAWPASSTIGDILKNAGSRTPALSKPARVGGARSAKASLWQPPERQLPKVIEPPWYDADHQVRKVRPTGEIKWRGGYIFIGEALAREPVGILEIDDGIHLVQFCGRDLGTINHTGRFHRFAPPRARLRCTMEPNQTNKE